MDGFSFFLPAIEPMPWIHGWRWWVVGVLLATGAWLGILRLHWFLLVRWNRPGGVTSDNKGGRTRTCPRCHFDMRGTDSLQCGECGWVAPNEAALSIRTPLRAAELAWLVTCVGFLGWVSFVYSRDRNWSPPLPYWRLVASTPLPHGVILSCYRERDPRYQQQLWRLVPPVGEPVSIEGWQFELGFRIPETAELHGTGETDINGNGTPDIVVNMFTDGCGCCSHVWVFEVLPDGSLHEVLAHRSPHDGWFQDVNGDGVLEFLCSDDAFKFQRAPTIISMFKDGRYLPAPELMVKPRLTDAALRELCVRHACTDWEGKPGDAFNNLLSTMLELMYSARSDQAWQLYETACRLDEPVRTEWTNQFLRTLSTSRYRELPELTAVRAMPPLP